MAEKKLELDVMASIITGRAVRVEEGSPVYGLDGTLVGRIGKEPAEPRPVVGADLLMVGFDAAAEKTKTAIGVILDELGSIAAEAKNKVRPSINLLSFESRLQSQAKLAELRARFDALKKEKDGLFLQLGEDPKHAEFRRLVATQLVEIETIFEDKG
jgi:hypothetical protein